jgi:4-hydroxybenzoyl-CoA thioesterase
MSDPLTFGAAHTCEQQVRFAHVDTAGIVFYPRYLELIDAAVEDWSEAAFGVDRRCLHQELGLGLPTAELGIRFERPSRLGDRLLINLRILEVAPKSVNLSVTVHCAGQRRLAAYMTLVLVKLATMRSHPWPAGWRASLEAAALNLGDAS